MLERLPSDSPSARLIHDRAARLLKEKPDITPEQLHSALAKVFLPPNGCPANAQIPDLLFLYFGLFGLARLRYQCWAFSRNKSAVEAVRTEIETVVAELTNHRKSEER